MKWRLYWSYGTRSLARGGQRSLLAIFCVAVGVMAIVSLQLVGDDATAGFTSGTRQLNGGDVSVAAQEAPLSSGQLVFFQRLETQGTITRYTAVDRVNAQVSTGTAALRFALRAVDPARFPLSGNIAFASPNGGDLATLLHGRSVVVTATLAQVFHLHLGSAFHFSSADGRAADVTVTGIVRSEGFFQGSSMLMALDAYAALPSAAEQPIAFDAIYLDVPGHGDASATRVAQQVRDAFPLTEPTTTRQLAAAYQSEAQSVRYFLQIVGLLALLIGGVGILNTIQVALRRRRTEIAMLKTVGYRRGNLYALFGLETGLVGLTGGVLGSVAAVAASSVVSTLMEHAIQMSIPSVVDPLTIGAGVAAGFCTALIFGLLPIVQASQVRPQAVLRELPERVGVSSRLLSVGLALALAVLFFALADIILRNALVTLGVVGSMGLVLLLLSLVFAGVVAVVGRLRVPERFRWWYALPAGAALVAAIGLAFVRPELGVVLMVAALLAALVAVWPRSWKASVKLALRNFGRQKGRTVLTLVALFTGIFAVGLVLTLGEDIRLAFTQRFTSSTFDVAVVGGAAERAAIEQQLARTPGVRNKVVNTISPDRPVAINGQPIADIVRAATAGGRYTLSDVTRAIDGGQGYALADGEVPNPHAFPLVRGNQDTGVGRSLGPGDAGTTNALLPISASQPPLNMRLGDTVTVASADGNAQVTVIIVGFYNSALDFEPMQVDNAVVATLAGGTPSYAYLMYVDPSLADATLARIQAALPAVQTYSLADILAQATSIIDNVTLLLIAVASLASLASVVIIANAVALALLERRREIGILKAVGYTSRGILGGVALENAATGLIGAGVAMLLVAVAMPFLGQILYNSPFSVPVASVLEVVPAAALVCMLVSTLVAWRATRVRPLEVLRYE